MGRLDRVDLSPGLAKAKAQRLAAHGRRLTALRLALGGKLDGPSLGRPVLVLFEGWDASGKGGAIKRLVAPLDIRHVRVAQFSAPTHDERRHHFLWRFWPVLPGCGGMAVLDRSWNGRVLVERVEEITPPGDWMRAYDEIVQFERSLAAEGTILVKLWLHISDAEQLRRFERRKDNPLKRWKLTAEDYRNREKRPQYGGHARAHRPRRRMPARDRGRVQALRAGAGDGYGDRCDRGRMRKRGLEPPALEEWKVTG